MELKAQDAPVMFQKSIRRSTRHPSTMDNLRKQWNEACLQTGIPALTLPTCARLMAILMHFGNNEALVLSANFRADCEYIQKRYHIEGGESPDMEFVDAFRPVEKELRDLDQPPEWAVRLMKEMYNINL